MERTAVNPWDWSVKLGYNQGEVIDSATRQVICAGQTAVDENGAAQHLGDMPAGAGAEWLAELTHFQVVRVRDKS